MGSEWPATKLVDFIEIKTGFPFKSNQFINDGDGIKLLRGDNIVQGSFRWQNVKLWPKGVLTARHKDYLLKTNDVILAMDRPWIDAGLKTGQISEDDLPCLLVQRVACLRSNDGDDQNFLRYLISSYWFVEYIKLVQTGTAVPHISSKQIEDYEFRKPLKEDRIKIGCCLRSLDDKIQLNRQMNQTLEQMAQALFKSWFVDFDPVMDNALDAGNPIPEALQARAAQRRTVCESGKATLPGHIRRLFPYAFVFNDEMGWIPEGWEVQPVGNVLDNVGGGTPRTNEKAFWDGGTHAFCTPKDMSTLTSKALLQTERHLTDSGVAKISSGQLPKSTVLMSSRAPIGYLAISDIPVSVNQGIIAIKPSKVFSSEYILSWTEAHMEEVISRSNGSTFLEISKKNFREIPFLIPVTDILEQFDIIAKAYFKRIVSIQKEVNLLSKLRDTLLPKLISGEIRIPEAKTLMEEVR